MKIDEQLSNIPFDIPEKKRIANNTVYYKDPFGNEYIRLHTTDVAIKINKTDPPIVRFNSGGYKTKVTKDRINMSIVRFLDLPHKVVSHQGVWRIVGKGDDILFFDGIKLQKTNGTVEVVNANDGPNEEEIRKLVQDTKKYANSFIDKFMNGEIPAPSGSDCFFCTMFPTSSADHIKSHIYESYYVPTLLYNAVFNNRFSQASEITKQYVLSKWGIRDKKEAENMTMYEDIVKDQLKKTLSKYLKNKLKLPM